MGGIRHRQGGAGHYLSVMGVNEDHYINKVIHDPGEHELTVAEFDTDYVAASGPLILVDRSRPVDVAASASRTRSR